MTASATAPLSGSIITLSPGVYPKPGFITMISQRYIMIEYISPGGSSTFTNSGVVKHPALFIT